MFKKILFPLVVGTAVLNAGPAVAEAGCPWVNPVNSQESGAIDTHANYRTALLPTGKDTGSALLISGHYPQLRFFNFTLYHEGKLIDHLADADLVPVEGGPANPNVAAIPYSNHYADSYQITIRFQDVPVVREPNTLYAGTDTSKQELLMMRDYLPNAGADGYGNAGLPQLAVVNADGSTTRWDNVDATRCGLVNLFNGLLGPISIPLFAVAPKTPSFAVIPVSTYNGNSLSTARYANYDSGYAQSLISTSHADLIIVRTRMPATPNQPVDPADLQVRYVSLCEYQKSNLAAVGCKADTETVTQSDGYANFVLSQTQPAGATAANGYTWMPALRPGLTSVLVLRQILSLPDFAGNYQVAGNAADPMAALGQWAPQITYCGASTFDSNAASGGAALFNACQSAYQAGVRH